MSIYLNGTKITGEVIQDGILQDEVYYNGVLVHKDILQPVDNTLVRMKGSGLVFVEITNISNTGIPPEITVVGSTVQVTVATNSVSWEGILSDSPVSLIITSPSAVKVKFANPSNFRNLTAVACDLSSEHVIDSGCFDTQTELTSFVGKNTSAVSNCHSMFKNTSAIHTVVFDNVTSFADMTNMFAVSGVLSFGDMDFPACTTTEGMFEGAFRLASIGDFNMHSNIHASRMFSQATSLKTVGRLTTDAAVIDVDFMFNYCTSLTCIKEIWTDSFSQTSNIFTNTPSLVSPTGTWKTSIENGYPWLDVHCNNDPDILYYKPTKILDFSASKLQTNKITITFTPADGHLAPEHHLYEGDVLLVANVTSGYVYSTTRSSITLRIKAINDIGHEFSNYDTGTTKAAGGSEIITYPNGSFVIPRGYTQIHLCLQAGGGSGISVYENPVNNDNLGGGFAGDSYNGNVTGLTSGETVTVTLGAGGAGSAEGSPSNAGSQSSFVSSATTIVLNGGAGGVKSSGYAGNSGITAGCSATYSDGARRELEGGPHYAYGGQGSIFGNGGAAATDSASSSGGSGIKGSGGGSKTRTASTHTAKKSGLGGSGHCTITWS